MGAWKLCHQLRWWFVEKPIEYKHQHFYMSSAALDCASDLEQVCECATEGVTEGVCAYVWLEVQYCAQIASDHSHVCDPAETMFELIRAREPNLLSWSNQADLDRYEKQGDFSSPGQLWFYKSAFTLYLYIPSVTKNAFHCLSYKRWGYLAFYSYLSKYHVPCLILCVPWVCVWYSLSQCLLYPLCIGLINSVLKYPVVEPLNLFWQIMKIEDYITARMPEKCRIRAKSKTFLSFCEY